MAPPICQMKPPPRSPPPRRSSQPATLDCIHLSGLIATTSLPLPPTPPRSAQTTQKLFLRHNLSSRSLCLAVLPLQWPSSWTLQARPGWLLQNIWTRWQSPAWVPKSWRRSWGSGRAVLWGACSCLLGLPRLCYQLPTAQPPPDHSPAWPWPAGRSGQPVRMVGMWWRRGWQSGHST